MNARKILSVILAVAMIMGTMGTVAFANETEVAWITGGTRCTSLNDAVSQTTEHVGMLTDVTENVTVNREGSLSFYLDGHTLNGTLKIESASAVSLNGLLGNGTTTPGTSGNKISATGAEGEYALWQASGANINVGAVSFEATNEDGVAIYCENGKVLLETSDDVVVNGDIKAVYTGIVNIKKGYYTGNLIEEGNASISVTGGTFEIDPSANVYPGYEAVCDEATGLYTVGVKENFTLSDLGTNENGEHTIDNALDVKIFRTLLNTTEGKNILSGEKFVLTTDIDMNGEVLPAAGGDAKRFMGSFYGNGHTISNVVIEATGESYVAFFGNTSGATIKDLTLENITVRGGAYTAGLVGFTRNTVIDNCKVIGNIDIAGGSHVAAIHAGGVVSITDCEVTGNPGSTISGSMDVAGLSALISEGSTTVTGNSVSGIAVTASSGMAGGLIGRAIVGTAGLEVNGNAVADCTVTATTTDYAGTAGLIIGCTQAISGVADYSDNTVADTTLTENGVEKDTLYVTKNYDGTDYSETIVSPVAEINGTYYNTLTDALNAVQNGETIELIRNVYLSSPVTFEQKMTVTLDGKGHSIVVNDVFLNADGTIPDHTVFFGNSGEGDDEVSSRNITVKNIVFDGITTKYGIRFQAVDATIENCSFVNSNQTSGFGLLNLTYTEAEVKGCTFKDNVCISATDINYNGDDCEKNVVIEKCIFDNNKCSGAGVVYYNDGNAVTVNNCEFTNNVISTGGNGATLYMGFNTNIVVTNNIFKKNTVTTTSDTSRVAGALFAGPVDDTNEISGNVFVGNSASNANGSDNLAKSVLAQPYAYYGNPDEVAVNLGENYWEDGSKPEAGLDYKYNFYSGAYKFALDSYYEKLDADGKPTSLVYDLEDLTQTSKKVVIEQVMDGTEPTDEFKVYLEGEYNGEASFIKNFVAAEIDFAVTGDFTITGFEVADTNWTSEITENDSYLIREKGAEDGAADITDKKILLGTLTLEGYGAGTIVAAGNHGAVEQRTEDGENVVVSTIAAPYTLDFNIYVPRKDLTVTIDFNNAVEKNVIDYQDMTVVVSGGDLASDITVKLGNKDQDVAVALDSKPGAKYTVDVDVDNKYTITVEDALKVDTTYTVTVKGAGYRTVRKNVTMTEDKAVNFWNNVKDAEGADYLAGDIVKDNAINIYDLSAVVSYFGRTNDTAAYSKYAKYDLNRDGKIDSKDVAYVLVSWGK